MTTQHANRKSKSLSQQLTEAGHLLAFRRKDVREHLRDCMTCDDGDTVGKVTRCSIYQQLRTYRDKAKDTVKDIEQELREVKSSKGGGK